MLHNRGLPALPLSHVPEPGGGGGNTCFSRCTASHSGFARGRAPATKTHSDRDAEVAPPRLHLGQ